jgi:hypothetical protein
MTQMSKAHYRKKIIGLDSIFTNNDDDETNSPTRPESEPKPQKKRGNKKTS